MFEHDEDDPTLRRLTAEEGAVLDATELICEVLDAAAITRTELARRLAVAPAEITQRLRGRNLTVKSLAATLDALDHVLVLDAKPRSGLVTHSAPVAHIYRTFGRQKAAPGQSYDVKLRDALAGAS